MPKKECPWSNDEDSIKMSLNTCKLTIVIEVVCPILICIAGVVVPRVVLLLLELFPLSFGDWGGAIAR